MKIFLFFAALTLLFACEKNGHWEDDNRTRIPTDPKELTLWNAVYDDEYKFPDGFYTESENWWTSINYLGDWATDENGRLFYKQYSTDSREQAQEWFYSIIEDNSEHPTAVEERETEKYFELMSVSESTYATHINRWRIHKSSYFVPVGMIFSTSYYDVIYPESYKPYTIGIYGGELSARAVKELIESLWYFETRQISGNKVLSTDFEETPDCFIYTFLSTSVTYGDWGLYDEIRVFESTLELDKTTRKLRSTDCILHQTIQGTYHTGMMR